MKAVIVKCPECGATLEASAGQTEAKCSYCGTASRVQRRTRFLQRAEPLPPQPQARPPLRVATQPRNVTAMIVALLVTLALPLGLGVITPIVVCHIQSIPRPNGLVLLTDVDKDGTRDLVLDARVNDTRGRYVVAHSGKDGKLLWRSSELRRGYNLGLFCVVDDTVLVGDEGPNLWGVSLADGALRFHRKFDEVVKTLCKGSAPGNALVITADGKRYDLALRDDAAKAGTSAGCTPLRCAAYRKTDGIEPLRLRHFQSAGMKADEALVHLASGTTIALGAKHPGSRVPMIARIQSVEGQAATQGTMAIPAAEVATWQAAVPGGDPLSAKADSPRIERVALDGALVAVAYETNGSRWRLSAFSAQHGKRRFDVALPKALHTVWSLQLSKRFVLVGSSWGMIAAYARDSGREAFVID